MNFQTMIQNSLNQLVAKIKEKDPSATVDAVPSAAKVIQNSFDQPILDLHVTLGTGIKFNYCLTRNPHSGTFNTIAIV